MTFAHPYLLLLLLTIPLAAWWRSRRVRQAAFLYSSIDLLRRATDLRPSFAARTLQGLRWLALTLFIVGLARPQLTESETIISASGIDIVIALDLSTSMEAEDFQSEGQQVNRLFIAKEVVRKFVEGRPSDRIALVAFAGKAYIAAPLTLDHPFLLANLERLNLRTIENGTAIGSALSASLNRLREIKSKSKIVILMTDGQNNSGSIPPLTAAEAARSLGVKVYTIGVGTRGMAPVPDYSTGWKRYVDRPVDIDEETLQAIADNTNGRYYRADNTDALKSIYAEIDQLEKTETKVRKYVRAEELFHWSVLPGLLLLLLEILLRHSVWRQLP